MTFGNQYATQTQAYSSELRGGYAVTWVIFADAPIVYPRVINTDILVAQAQDAVQRFAGTLKKDGTLLLDSDTVTDVPAVKAKKYAIAATSIARQQFSAPIVANIIMLGALTKVHAVTGRQDLEKAIAAAVPKNKVDMNLKAFAAGFDMVKPCGS
ncbi:2-oxoglutarate ferredoxin oxidoreductase subunit gamma [Deltaproteobacteria bacterium]|nr:2-oxoglutarate ferredoxin oxidoreductase subunit gamma [Deltaproteobacteria bacterium]